MFKINLFSLAVLASSSLYASEVTVEEYKGQISNLYIGKSGKVRVGVIKEEDNLLNCGTDEDNQLPLFFDLGQSYSDHWLDLLNLVRRTKEHVNIGFINNNENTCEINYISILNSKNGSSSETPYDNLERIGQYGNISLIYTNGLTDSSYSASDHYSDDVASAAFDGYVWQDVLEENQGSLINRGIWLVKRATRKDEKDENLNIEYWLQVEFPTIMKVSGFRTLVNERSVQLGRSPKNITILGSTDGEEFTEIGNYTLAKAKDQRADLPSVTELKYFRVKINSNYGDSFIEIDELEVYSDQ